MKYISEGIPYLKLNTELTNLFSFSTAQTHFLFKGSLRSVRLCSYASPWSRGTMKRFGWKITRFLEFLEFSSAIIRFCYPQNGGLSPKYPKLFGIVLPLTQSSLKIHVNGNNFFVDVLLI